MNGKMRLAVALGALVALAAVVAYGDNNVVDHGTYYANGATGAKTDANGNAYTNEASKDRDNFQIITVTEDTLSNGGAVSISNANAATQMTFSAESSAVYPTYMYKKFKLFIRVIPGAHAAADSAITYRLAVQIRSHTGALDDSSHTFAWTSWANTSTALLSDSTSNRGPAFLASGASPNFSERVFEFVGARGRGDINTRQSGQMTWPDGIAVDLIDSRGQWYWAPYTSVRVRLIANTSATASGTAAGCPRVMCYLAMGS